MVASRTNNTQPWTQTPSFVSQWATRDTSYQNYQNIDDTAQSKQRSDGPSARAAVCAIIPAFTAVSWTTMMIYFFFYYVSLPKIDGRLPRLNDHYSTWPYISCIGAALAAAFEFASCVTATGLLFTFFFYAFAARRIRAGWRWRLAMFFFGIVTAVFLVALAFNSVAADSTKHIILTAFHLTAAMFVQLCDAISTILLQRVGSNVKLKRARTWKLVAGIIAFPTGWISVGGIYGCDNHSSIIEPGTTCFKVTAISAPCEWILSFCFMAYLLAVAYTLWFQEEIFDDIYQQELRSGIRTTAMKDSESVDEASLIAERLLEGVDKPNKQTRVVKSKTGDYGQRFWRMVTSLSRREK